MFGLWMCLQTTVTAKIDAKNVLLLQLLLYETKLKPLTHMLQKINFCCEFLCIFCYNCSILSRQVSTKHDAWGKPYLKVTEINWLGISLSKPDVFVNRNPVNTQLILILMFCGNRTLEAATRNMVLLKQKFFWEWRQHPNHTANLSIRKM